MAILVPVSMIKQGITITKNKTKYTRITDYVSINIDTDDIYARRQTENRERWLLEWQSKEPCGPSAQRTNVTVEHFCEQF